MAQILLPPEFRRNRESNIFIHTCLSVHTRLGWGVPPSSQQGACPHPFKKGGAPSFSRGGYPLIPDRGQPHPSHLANGGVGGYPLHQDCMVYPLPCQDWMQYSPLGGWVYPPSSPCQDWMGYPSPPPILRQSRRASTCCAAAGMPLAFT